MRYAQVLAFQVIRSYRMKLQLLIVVSTLAMVAVLVRWTPGSHDQAPPSQSSSGNKEGISISGFQPGMRAQDILNEHPGKFQVLTNRLQAEQLALITDIEGKVIAVEARPGSSIERDGKPLFAYNDGYYKAKQVVSSAPGVVVRESSIRTTEVELDAQVLRLVHKYQTGPLGNKGLLADVILLESKD
jgi:hypothetical protein